MFPPVCSESGSSSIPELAVAAVEGEPWTGPQRLEAAYDSAEKAGDVAAMALVVLAQAGLRVNQQRNAAGDVMLSRLRQLAGLIDPRSSLGVRIRTRLAAESDYRSGAYAATIAMVDEATQLGGSGRQGLGAEFGASLSGRTGRC